MFMCVVLKKLVIKGELKLKEASKNVHDDGLTLSLTSECGKARCGVVCSIYCQGTRLDRGCKPPLCRVSMAEHIRTAQSHRFSLSATAIKGEAAACQHDATRRLPWGPDKLPLWNTHHKAQGLGQLSLIHSAPSPALALPNTPSAHFPAAYALN